MQLTVLRFTSEAQAQGLDDGALRLTRHADGRLLATRDGVTRVVRLRQSFPWTEPGRFLSLRDDEDQEFALIEDPRTLDAASRRALQDAQVVAGFVLEVTRVVSIEDEVEVRHWKVETHQGSRTFQTRLDDWPRLLPDGGLLVRDVAGDLYLVEDPDELDQGSRELLWAFVD